MKTKKHKSKFSPEVNRLFNGFFKKANKIAAMSTLTEWPSHRHLDRTSAELNKAMEELERNVMRMKKSLRSKV